MPLCSFATVLVVTVGLKSASINLLFNADNRIIKTYLKTMGEEKKKKNRENLFNWLTKNSVA